MHKLADTFVHNLQNTIYCTSKLMFEFFQLSANVKQESLANANGSARQR